MQDEGGDANPSLDRDCPAEEPQAVPSSDCEGQEQRDDFCKVTREADDKRNGWD